jgi:hypothetical protein
MMRRPNQNQTAKKEIITQIFDDGSRIDFDPNTGAVIAVTEATDTPFKVGTPDAVSALAEQALPIDSATA